MVESDTRVPETPQTLPVSEAKLTDCPDVALALILNGAVPRGSFARPLNVMLWLAGFTVKF